MEEKNYEIVWGVDISKHWFDISINQKVQQVKQTRQAINAFIRKHKTEQTTLVILESTGGYENLAVECFAKAGLIVHRAHPNKIKAYIAATGKKAKTDKQDAKAMEGYGFFMDPSEIYELPTELERELKDMSRRLKQLKGMLHREQCRIKMTHCKAVKASMRSAMRLYERQIAKLEEQIIALIQTDEKLLSKYELLQSMSGVGVKTAITLISELPQLGRANKKQLASLVGIAPITRESGLYKGYGGIRHGRGSVRKALYMAALVASRRNSKMKAFYQHLLSQGKKKKVALVAVMRKMLTILNAMVKNNVAYSLDF